jgi:hypothetical protein
MATHKVRNPFLCRDGQFAAKGYPGRILVVGIAHAALKGEYYRMKIGSNQTIYTAPVTEIMFTAHQWRNKSGKLVFITPLALFTKGDQDESKKLHSVPVPEKPDEIQKPAANDRQYNFSL